MAANSLFASATPETSLSLLTNNTAGPSAQWVSTWTSAEPQLNGTTSEGGSTQPSLVQQPYELVWTSEVLFRVTTIIVIMVLTLIGNITLITIIVCHRKLRTKRVNIFLVNLAVGDLMVCLVTMTTEILFVAFGEWVMGAAGCKLVVYGQIVTLASATFLLTAMSIDRYQVIVQPLQSITRQVKIWHKVCLAWILAFVFATPQMFIFVQTDEGVYPDGRIRHLCRSKGYTAMWQRKLYFTYLTAYILIVPTVIMTFCYSEIIRVVWMRTVSSNENDKPKFRFVSKFRRLSESTQKAKLATNSSFRRGGAALSQRPDPGGNKLRIPKRLISSSKRNVIKMTLSVIAGFVICWLPYFVVSLIRIYSNYSIKLSQALSVTEIMALVHSALNPILYGMFSTQAAKRLCSQICAPCCRSRSSHSMDNAFSEDDSTWTDARYHRVSVSRAGLEAHRVSSGGALGRARRQLSSCFGSDTDRDKPCADSNRPLLIYRKVVLNGARVPAREFANCRRTAADIPGRHGVVVEPRCADRRESRSSSKTGAADTSQEEVTTAIGGPSLGKTGHTQSRPYITTPCLRGVEEVELNTFASAASDERRGHSFS